MTQRAPRRDVTTSTGQECLKMSLTKEPPRDSDRKDTQEEDELSPEGFDGKDVQVKDFLKTSQTEKRAVSPLTLLKEDFNQFKEEVRKVFKDKDASSRTSHPAEKLISPLTLLKDDFNHLKEDLSSVFRIGLSKERDDKGVAVKEASSNISKTGRAGEPPKGLFSRDRSLLKTPRKAKDVTEVKKSREEAGDERNDRMDESEEKSEIRNSFTQTQQSGMSSASYSADHKSETGDWSDDSSVVSGGDGEDEPSESRPRETQESSGITLLSLRNAGDISLRDRPAADPWSPKNFACYLTFDPNTANSELHLSDGNRRATRVWLDRRPAEHPERFCRCPQVLCREGLLDPAYWEVVWSGGVDIGVTYNNISRDGDMESCLLGHNECSWSLECSDGCYTPCHNRRRFKSLLPEPFTHRVGVFLNWPAGSLSFYCVSPDTMVHLHTFTSTFTEPLYPGFWVWSYDGSATLSQVALDWERLLQ